jgi:UDP-glucose 4-epimerase
MPRVPDDIYGLAKTAMERSTEILSQVHNFKYVIIRPHNVYGPRQNMSDPYRNVIAIFINRLLQGKHFFIFGDGKQKRAFTYIDDCVPYILKSAFTEQAENEIFNIGPTNECSVNQLANKVLYSFFGTHKISSKYLPRYLPMRPLEVKDAWCSIKKAEQILGYKTSVSLNEGINKMVAWAKLKGPQQFVYLKELEIEQQKTPKVWTKKLI